eukprot:GILK01010084.1.p1 GENE.GILK01010084.1~~GILK01010084.1.p1  ORF type:complete len:314 (-),score=37.80 GILK01010084.1:152-1093(-)
MSDSRTSFIPSGPYVPDPEVFLMDHPLFSISVCFITLLIPLLVFIFRRHEVKRKRPRRVLSRDLLLRFQPVCVEKPAQLDKSTSLLAAAMDTARLGSSRASVDDRLARQNSLSSESRRRQKPLSARKKTEQRSLKKAVETGNETNVTYIQPTINLNDPDDSDDERSKSPFRQPPALEKVELEALLSHVTNAKQRRRDDHVDSRGSSDLGSRYSDRFEADNIQMCSILKGCLHLKQLQIALELFNRFKQNGVQMDLSTYEAMIETCVRCGDLRQACLFLHELEANRLVPSLTLLDKIMELCSRRQQYLRRTTST